MGTPTNDAARALGLDEKEIIRVQDLDPDEAARKLGISEKGKLTVVALGTPATVPGAPTSPVATVTNATRVSVAFTAPGASGGAQIKEYEVTSSPGGFVGKGRTSPVLVDATFVQAQAYTFTVKAKNDIGKSAASAASAAVTPKP